MKPFDGHTPEFLAALKKRMTHIDAMSKEHRELVHEFNYSLVNQFLAVGVTKPKHIRHLITACRDTENFGGNGKPQFHCHDCPYKFPNPASSPNGAGIPDRQSLAGESSPKVPAHSRGAR